MTGDLPRWAVALVRVLSPPGEIEDVLGDLAEAHQHRLRRRGGLPAHLSTAMETLEMAVALVRARAIRTRIQGSTLVQDYQLGLRMLAKYPGLTVAGGLALAIAIGVGAAWFDVTRDMWRPVIPLPEGDRIVTVEMRDARRDGTEHRILHDFVGWRREARSLADVGAYRTVQRNLVFGDARLEPVTAAEITAAAFALARVPPLLGRPILEADERPGAPPVAVLGYTVWRRYFGGRRDLIGQAIRIGRDEVTVVGVMPEGFAYPVNHRLWTPLTVSPAGYEPLTGPPVQVVARLAAGVAQAEASAEISTFTDRVRGTSPAHEHLRPRVLAYGGQSVGNASLVEFASTHLPILLVLAVACVNVGTLVYARTATRDAEIAIRFALGASRTRIVTQLFVEALVLAAVAAAIGLTGAHLALRWATQAFNAGDTGGLPFWVDPGLKPTTVLFAAGMTTVGAAILGVLPALKATRAQVHARLRNLGAGATLRFGKVWTTAMIAQVAFAVICLTPARGISEEALRDRRIRGSFPAEAYVSVRLDLDRQRLAAGAEESEEAYAIRYALTYQELERRLRQEPGVRAVTFGDRLPGMDVDVRTAQLDVPAQAPRLIPSLWSASVGPGYFEAFGARIVAGRDFHDGDRVAGSTAAIVNEAFVRRFLIGRHPIGARVRYAAGDIEDAPEGSSTPVPLPWLEIVGVASDIGMTPTDFGEAPYVFRPTTPAAASPLVLGVHVAGDAGALAPRVREIAAALDPGLRLSDLAALEDLVWREDVPMMLGAVAVVVVVSLGLFLSAAGIYALMSVSVARRTREIGLRAALGASRAVLVRSVVYRAAALVGSGVAAGNGLLLFFAWQSGEVSVARMAPALLGTSAVMLGVGLLACVEPARRALRIQPIDALRES